MTCIFCGSKAYNDLGNCDMCGAPLGESDLIDTSVMQIQEQRLYVELPKKCSYCDGEVVLCVNESIQAKCINLDGKAKNHNKHSRFTKSQINGAWLERTVCSGYGKI